MALSTYSLSFDGASGQVSSSPSSTSTPFGVSLWLKYSSTSAQFVMSMTNGGNNSAIQLAIGSGTGELIAFYSRAGGASATLTSPSSYADGSWHHVAITCDVSSNLTLWVDGSLVATDGSGTNVTNVQINTSIWGHNSTPAQYYGGSLCQFAFWQGISLGSTDISNLVAGTDPATLHVAEQVVVYEFTEGTSTTLTDSSGNDVTGTLTGGVTWSSDVPSALAGGGGGGGSALGALWYYHLLA